MGVLNYKNISNLLEDGFLNNECGDVDRYIRERTHFKGRSFAISDSSYSAISKASSCKSDPSANRLVQNINEMVKQLVLQSGFPQYFNKRSDRYSFINVLDPEKRLGGEEKINRASIGKYTNNTFECPMKPHDMKCIGNYFDFIISFFVDMSRYTRYEINALKTLSFLEMDKGTFEEFRSKLKYKSRNVTFPTNVPNGKSLRRKRGFSQKLIKLTKRRIQLLTFLETVMDIRYFQRFLYVVRTCSCLESSSMMIYKDVIDVMELKIQYKDFEFDIDIDTLNDKIYDKASLTAIKNIKGYNTIKEIVYEILKQRTTIEKHLERITFNHLNVFCIGVEADWVIVSLTHILKQTTVYTRDSDILILGQSHVFQQISKSVNRLLLVNILKRMCRKNNNLEDLVRVVVLIFSTGSDYFKHEHFGAVAFVKCLDNIILKYYDSEKSKFDIDEIVETFRKKASYRHSALSFIGDSILAIAVCFKFYFTNTKKCSCRECIKLEGGGEDV